MKDENARVTDVRELHASEIKFQTGLGLAKFIQDGLPGYRQGNGRSPIGRLLDQMFYTGMNKDTLTNILNDITLLANQVLQDEPSEKNETLMQK